MSKSEQLDIKQLETRRERIIEKIGSCTIRDPYRWFEKNNLGVDGWVRKQHEYTMKNILNISGRDRQVLVEISEIVCQSKCRCC